MKFLRVLREARVKKTLSRPYGIVALVLILLCLSACAARGPEHDAPQALQTAGAPPAAPAPDTQTLPRKSDPQSTGPAASSPPEAVSAKLKEQVADCWTPLFLRLNEDNLANTATYRYFRSLPQYSQNSMGAKVAELFKSAFMRKPSVAPKGAAPPPRVYKSVMTEANSQKCIQFLEAHKAVFDGVEARHKVPREIIVSLLFVETRLGEFMGKENALWSLACMASATTPEHVAETLKKLPYKEEQHAKWLQAKLDDKSNWAYKELKALLTHCLENNLDPRTMPGSVYGAIGLCQFMPSNIAPYGEDGDGDGIVNLFSIPDALYSTARFLTAHGWKENMTMEQRRKVLKRYNNLNIYANTILAMADAVKAGGLLAFEMKKETRALAADHKAKPGAKPKSSTKTSTRTKRG